MLFRTEKEVTMYEFKLYVSGISVRSEQIHAALSRTFDKLLSGKYNLEIIDLLEDPQRAREANVLVTPTLIKSKPLPLLRLVGDFSNMEVLRKLLDL